MSERINKSPIGPVAALVIGSIAMLLPLGWMLLTSLKTFPEVLAYPPVWWPAHPQWNNYIEAFRQFHFAGYLRNSLFLVALNVTGTLVSCTMAAYAFAFLEWRHKNILFGLLLSSMMLPGQVTVIPLFQLYVKLHWINTYWPLTIPSWLGCNVFGIFLLRQFFLTIPKDYLNAARIDGASEWLILRKVIIPMASPALLTVGVFTFVGSWNDLWGPLIFLHDERLYTLPVGLMNFIGMAGTAEGTPWHLMMAVATTMMLPIVMLFFFAQKSFIEGIATAGIKE
ncbi:MAG TPA: carbohydrate ABC transporter permease [Capsulimonadaceae bacterium]